MFGRVPARSPGDLRPCRWRRLVDEQDRDPVSDRVQPAAGGAFETSLRGKLAQRGAACGTDDARFGAQLRVLRRREMVRIAWRDLAGLASLHTTLRETSWFAEAVIASATRGRASTAATRLRRRVQVSQK